eukprot:4524351-Pyramimonas_sp.AAC.1
MASPAPQTVPSEVGSALAVLGGPSRWSALGWLLMTGGPGLPCRLQRRGQRARGRVQAGSRRG